ncbi:F420-0:gamma-glutamyl ligase [Paraburkholderia sp. CI3]
MREGARPFRNGQLPLALGDQGFFPRSAAALQLDNLDWIFSLRAVYATF